MSHGPTFHKCYVSSGFTELDIINNFNSIGH